MTGRASPLVDAQVILELVDYPYAPAVEAVTDTLGRVRLELPVGSWRIRHVRQVGGRDVASSGSVAWTTAGPTARVVDLVLD